MYDYTDIATVSDWQQFNLVTIMQRYGNLTAATSIHSEPFVNTPSTSLNIEESIRHEITRQMMEQTRYALRAAFERLQVTN
ncbi:hypothetical protein EMCG_01366 [[Emmonsia] crescens]|uniref:Uncharacterized protein n=1 Tax=[Emmonsia] crescens TaxID=73230 RepID=A0A0G2I2S2_9EURO|nr:hypothetical protein EMCG_01366 [Emmonsia crescens UAMH 3008]